jgi:hypothetical protein
MTTSRGDGVARIGRRLWAGLLAAVALVAATLLVPAGAASAAGGSGSPVAPYPPHLCANLAVSSTIALPGGSIDVTGTHYLAHAHIKVILTQGDRTWVLAKVVSSATGTFQTTVTLPAGVTGKVTISTTGGTPDGCVLDPILITISAGGVNGGGGPPAHTGVNVEAMVFLAALLLAVGTPLAVTRRRRPQLVHRRKAGTGPAIFLPPHRGWDSQP